MSAISTDRFPIIPILLAITSLLIANPALATSDDPTITVAGDAEVRVVPDEVILTAGVESRAKTVAEASQDNDTKIRAVLDFLKKTGIEDRHIRTEYLTIEPVYRNPRYYPQGKANAAAQQAANTSPFAAADTDNEDSEKVVGYKAARQFAITITDLKLFETVYKGLIEQGINRVRGIEFRSSELRKYRDKVRLEAVRAAREKAAALATELGATLKAVKTIQETRGPSPSAGAMYQNRTDDIFDGSDTSAASFSAGQISITAAVEVVFILADTELKE
ncbi:MAG: SIMPL domain-containing protein [Pirellulales bacterium]